MKKQKPDFEKPLYKEKANFEKSYKLKDDKTPFGKFINEQQVDLKKSIESMYKEDAAEI